MRREYEFTVYRGTFIQLGRLPESDLTSTPSKPELQRTQGILWVSAESGIRLEGSRDGAFTGFMSKNGWVDVDGKTNGNLGGATKVKIVEAREDRNEFFFPGFIDTHIHAPQYPNAGLFGSSTLLDWLETYTFPVESGFGTQPTVKGQSQAQKPEDAPESALLKYDQVVSRTLAHGTTCASYFATIHVPATNALAAICQTRGQRAFIGRVCMDEPGFCPDYYRDLSAEDSLSATKDTIHYIHTLDPKGALVKPIVTPRFAPTCSRPSLTALAITPPLHIQTHIAENKNEVTLVKDLFPEAESYAAVYDQHNLLTPRTILAHAVHLSKEERTLIKARDAKISHCPASNSALGSGIAPVRDYLNEGITVGLGTDVSGGYSPSILEAARQACLSSRLLGHTKDYVDYHSHAGHGSKSVEGGEKLSVAESLYLATRGGAAVVNMEDDIGGFEIGMIMDAQLIQLGSVRMNGASPLSSTANMNGGPCTSLIQSGPVGNVDIFGTESWEEKIQKWVWSGDDRNVKAVWVGGRMVHWRV
ncbi:Amidohydrolase 1 [Penicillium waksmanii]|uniref:Amidohydrolase 1 n=1 Tax=Penicillium waksmanii TaxID=69791 RepID=UPI002547167B|nr:Amidohydrolase 1 [Penicillium waksmanii]KAJ5979786.1 Amidohydrolase 1 [Penicillium waksmanii]